MRRRKGKFGEFYGCTGYPVCKNTMSIKDAAYEPEVLEIEGNDYYEGDV